MALNVFTAADQYLQRRSHVLLDAVSEQPLRQWTAEKREILELARHDERLYHWIAERGLTSNFIDLLMCPSDGVPRKAAYFLQSAVQYESQWAAPLRGRLLRVLQLLAADVETAHEAGVLMTRLTRNEHGHPMFLEYAYSWSDLLQVRKWPRERAAICAVTYILANPHLMIETAGVMSRTDLLVRIDSAYRKSNDLFVRRCALLGLELSGTGKMLKDEDDVNSLIDYFRVAPAGSQALLYFATSSTYAFSRHLLAWGVRGQMGPVAAASAIAGLTAAWFGVYTGEWLRYRVDCQKWQWLMQYGQESRRLFLKLKQRSITALPGRAAGDTSAPANPRFENLEKITADVTDTTFATYKWGIGAVCLLGVPLPWYRAVPRVLSTYQQMRMGPAFHRIFPALSLKYVNKPRAIVPYVLVPVLATKCFEAMPAHWREKVPLPYDPFRHSRVC